MLDRLQNAGRLAGVAAMLIALAPALASADPSGATLRAVRMEAVGATQARLALEFAGRAPDPRIFALPDPKPRLVIDLPGAAIDRAGETSGAGPVSGVRFAQHSPDLARVVLDLASPATHAPPIVEAAAGGAQRLIYVINAQGAPPKQRRTIVIDPGHGGKDPGALGPTGAQEKEITLAAALALRSQLEARGYRVVMTRGGDAYLPLFDRVARAREVRADLFVSLHADASPTPSTKGASIYTLSERGERRARTIAGAQNWELDLSEPVASPTVGGILLDLAQRETTNRSADFAQVAIAHLGEEVELLRNTHRSAGFAVLLAPDVPAILLEMGFLTNAEDEARLVDERRRAALMRRLADAVDAFFTPPRLVAGR